MKSTHSARAVRSCEDDTARRSRTIQLDRRGFLWAAGPIMKASGGEIPRLSSSGARPDSKDSRSAIPVVVRAACCAKPSICDRGPSLFFRHDCGKTSPCGGSPFSSDSQACYGARVRPREVLALIGIRDLEHFVAGIPRSCAIFIYGGRRLRRFTVRDVLSRQAPRLTRHHAVSRHFSVAVSMRTSNSSFDVSCSMFSSATRTIIYPIMGFCARRRAGDWRQPTISTPTPRSVTMHCGSTM